MKHLCQNGASTCKGGPRRTYYRPMTGGMTASLCDECVDTLRRMGMDFLLLPQDPVNPPAWLANIKAKELTRVA